MPQYDFDLPDRISLAHLPTPFVALKRLSAKLGGPRIWIKRDDLSGALLTGNKVRKLEFVVAEALKRGATTLITCGGLQSNHCRATAVVGAQLGLKVHLILRKDDTLSDEQEFPDGNYLIDNLVGAKTSTYSVAEYSRQLEKIFATWQAHYESQGETCHLIPTGASDGIGVSGYLAAALEMQEDFEREKIEPTHLYCASGSGGTQAGLSLGFNLLQSPMIVNAIAVCDSAEYFRTKVIDDVEAWCQRYNHKVDVQQLAIVTNENFIGPGYAKVYPEMIEAIRLLAETEGVVLDPVYTGKAFCALLQDIEDGRLQADSDVVFLHTGGIFGVFPYRKDLARPVNSLA